jgi:rhamnose transport system permease protein
MPNMLDRDWLTNWLKSWEALLALIFVNVVIANILLSSHYFNIDNLVKVFHLSIEKAIVALVMTLIIINGEIDLSVASVMALGGAVFAYLYKDGTSPYLAILAALAAGAVCGGVNGFWVAYIGLPSLAVTLTGLIGYRGIARILLENTSIGAFPQWFNDIGQKPLVGPFPVTLILFVVLFAFFAIVLHFSAFGRYVYSIGNNREAARFSGVRVRPVKMILFITSGFISSLAGVLYVARLGTVRAHIAEGFELDIITMVLLGGVSIFGGKGSLVGVGLSILVVLNLRNGLLLAGITGTPQTSIVGALLILSVLIPNLAQELQRFLNRHRFVMIRSPEIRQEETSSIEIEPAETL